MRVSLDVMKSSEKWGCSSYVALLQKTAHGGVVRVVGVEWRHTIGTPVRAGVFLGGRGACGAAAGAWVRRGVRAGREAAQADNDVMAGNA